MKLDEKALKAAFYVFMDAKAKEAAIDRLRLVIEAYLATLPADDALIDLIKSYKRNSNIPTSWEQGINAGLSQAITLIRQHQSIQIPPVCNNSGKDVNEPPEHQSSAKTTGCGDYICDDCGKRCWFAAPHHCQHQSGEGKDV